MENVVSTHCKVDRGSCIVLLIHSLENSHSFSLITIILSYGWFKKKNNGKQAGAEPGQAQLKLILDFSLIFCRFSFS